ncbi:hypothetical protein J6590_002518 [Homalodisca vitripennis]|nr:hypothetical protein J6590_002518 [Homalodisca vitripennis]
MNKCKERDLPFNLNSVIVSFGTVSSTNTRDQYKPLHTYGQRLANLFSVTEEWAPKTAATLSTKTVANPDNWTAAFLCHDTSRMRAVACQDRSCGHEQLVVTSVVARRRCQWEREEEICPHNKDVLSPLSHRMTSVCVVVMPRPPRH